MSVGKDAGQETASPALQTIQCWRAVAILLVMGYHLASIEAKYSDYRWLAPLLDFGFYGVDLFFVISGFIISYIGLPLMQARRNAGRFLWRRILRIYPLYWEFTLLVLAVYLWRPEWVNSSAAAPPDMLASFLLLPQAALPLLAVGWSLVYEMFFYCCFTLLFLPGVRWLLPLLLLWATVLVMGGWQGWGDCESAACILLQSPLTLEFLAGCLAGILYRGYGKRLSSWVLGGIGLACLLPAQFIPLQGEYHRVWQVAVPAACWLLAGAVWERQRTSSPQWRWLLCVGDASYSLYLSHVLVFSALGKVWQSAGGSGYALHCGWLLLMLMAALTFGILHYQWVERPFLQTVKRRRRKGNTGETAWQHTA